MLMGGLRYTTAPGITPALCRAICTNPVSLKVYSRTSPSNIYQRLCAADSHHSVKLFFFILTLRSDISYVTFLSEFKIITSVLNV